MRFRSHVVGLGILASTVATPVLACIETTQDSLGFWEIHNGCDKAVWVAWCFGSGCMPEGSTAKLLNPGFRLAVGGRKQHIRTLHCFAPGRFNAYNRCQ
jgi:hypothetical protein